MGQKVNPLSFRMGVTLPWRSRWYASKKNFGDWLVEDSRIRDFIRKEYGFAGLSRISRFTSGRTHIRLGDLPSLARNPPSDL